MRVDEETWAEIRRVHSETTLSIAKIAVRFNVGHSTIDQRALKEGWPPRPSREVRNIPPPAERVAALMPASLPATNLSAEPAWNFEPREPDTPATRTYRLLRLIDLQLDHMEKRMTTGEPMTAQDQERQARAFSTIIGHLETLTETPSENDKSRDAGWGAQDGGGHLEAERLRREIAERLERLNAQWLAQTKSE